MIWNGNVLMQKKLIRKIIEKMASYLCNYKWTILYFRWKRG